MPIRRRGKCNGPVEARGSQAEIQAPERVGVHPWRSYGCTPMLVICLESTVQKILLPTDGSSESEKALTIAWRVAQAQSAELILARVVEPVTESLTAAGGDVSPDAYQR